jgi:hypothetical protein
MAAGIGACGGGGDARGQVNDYVRQANAIQHRYAPDFKRADSAYVALARGDLTARRAVMQLTSAERAIAAARRQVQALPAPADARALRARLLRYLDMNVAFAHQINLLADYQWRSPTVLRGLARANARLRTGMRATTPAGQAAALQDFAATLRRTVRGLRALRVPRVLRPVHDQQLRRLETTGALAGQLQRALLAGDAGQVTVLLARFRTTNASPRSARSKAIRAIDQYNRRFRLLARAYSDVRREQVRLDRSLG